MNNDAPAATAFIGGGHMARALIAGLLRQGTAPQALSVGEPLPEARAALCREFSVRAEADNAAAIAGARVIVLAVKPQAAAAVLRSLPAAALAQRPLLLSIAAGLRIADLAQLLPVDLPIVRAMPNRPALLGKGSTGLFAAPSVSAAQRALAEQIASAAGHFVWLRTEPELDVVTALSGSGPAYFFLLAEQLAQAAIELGLEPATAQLLARQTLQGSGALARADTTLAEERAAVTSRGGTTEAALRTLDSGGFGALVASALRAAAARSAELADELSSSLNRHSDTG
jgi:pyrroline-5-carboxylate reductase